MTVEHLTNRVLATLAHAGGLPWRESLERVDLPPGEVLLEPKAPIEFVYFPAGALVSLVHTQASNGRAVPMALVGHDGVVGVAPFVGAAQERMRAEVLHPGNAWRLPAAVLHRLPLPGEHVLKVVLLYLQTLNAQMSQAALCQLQHTLYQRLCRWLQDAFDRVPDTELRIEHAALSAWLDAEPQAMARAVAQLVAEGAIEQQPGRIRLLDREQLGWRSCDCHLQVKQQLDRLLPLTA